MERKKSFKLYFLLNLRPNLNLVAKPPKTGSNRLPAQILKHENLISSGTDYV